ncbi:GntR family transcriptional regulator [Gordonia sp. L191]|uniref:GntR family transcriptional regulator n=1 Tax=Gordonia sp. L191 TaxID=2982699 RepID=UPI0024BF24A8|nr:GntR family transcriptional regulator [Gordonia sp. L191]WHU46815.1 GntR family transcriptional regulator [Gordonia sp. L191]
MPSMTNRPTASAADDIRSHIEEEILAGRWAPGGKINADELARTRGVSHIPVREALRALEADGWVVRRHHRGMFVRERDVHELTDLFETRLIVECQAASLAAQRRTTDELEQLAAIIDRQLLAVEHSELALCNALFHDAVAACAHNAVLSSVVTDLSKRVRFYYLPTAGARQDHSVAEHRAIVEAIADRRSADAKELMARHISDTRSDASDRLGD